MSKKMIARAKHRVFEHNKVVVSGGSNYDIKGSSTGVFTAKTSNPGKVLTGIGGVGRNIAETLARLGVHVTLLSAVGEDIQGDTIIQRTQDSGVNMSYVLQSKKLRTGVYIALHNNIGEMEAALSDMDVAKHIDYNYLKQCSSVLEQADIIVADTNTAEDGLQYLADYCAAEDKLFVVEPVSVEKARKLTSIINQIDVLSPNRAEAEKLCGFPLNTHDDYLRAWEFFAHQGVEILLLKMGQEGMGYFSREEILYNAAPSCQPVNVTGAGDTLVGAWIAGLCQGLSPRQCCDLAVAAAGCTMMVEDSVDPNLGWEKIKGESDYHEKYSQDK